ncbi:MAG: methyl-accepting chemotaxis protein [Saccharospirillum sp.]|uniref:HAMP domain-containing methyl-accepting chemotaxis protein n=1 Tax=Saccharospirillum sp. TaxID=2033801 RepID=UPI003298CDA0
MVVSSLGMTRITVLKKYLSLPRLTLVTRLSVGFGLVGIGVLCMLGVSLFSLQQSSQSVNSLVTEALPVKEALADARLTLKDISTGAAEHYNARQADVMATIRGRVESDIQAFNERADRLATDFPLLSQSPELEARLTQSVQQAREQFERVALNMNTHERSIEAETRITEVRGEIDRLRAEAGPAFDTNLARMEAPEAVTLAFRLQRLFDTVSLLAINASLADSLDVIESAQADLRDSLDAVATLTFDIFDQVDADPAFADYNDAIDPLFDQVNSLATANDGLIARQTNLFVDIRSELPGKIEAVQASLANTGGNLQALSQQVDTAVTGISEAALDQVAVGRYIVIVATIVILLLCLAVSWVVVRSVRRPIHRLSKYMKQVGNGDFSARVGNYPNDEIGEIFHSTEQLVDKIREMIVRIADLNRDINAISTDTAESTKSVRSRLNLQSEDLNSVAAAVTEMAASVRDVAHNTRQAAGEMVRSEERAHDIETAVRAAVNSNQKLTVSMQEATGVIETLDGEVAGIDQILDVIRNITEQTNLLALNAAIEAARAGEQGRGFAVVADEVRTLASRTQTYTQEIAEKIDCVMAGSREAVASISTSVKDANDISGRVGDVQGAFSEYLTFIARVSELNGQVSVATDEQQAVSEDITKRTNTISDTGAVVAADFESTVQRTAELNEIADHLDQAIKRFQL